MVDLKSETLHLLEDAKFLKESINKCLSKLIEHEKHLSKLLTLFEERIEKNSVNNRISGKIKAAKFEPEKTFKRR